ncbi:hypothetical protein ACPA9J_16535 [Pseudomonas aeruginosa]
MLATKISFINQIAELAEHPVPTSRRVRQGIGAPTRGSATTSSHLPVATAAPCFPVTCAGSTAPSRRIGSSDLLQVRKRSTGGRSLPFECIRVLRRRPARQDLRLPGPGLQAEHRRHATRPAAN